MKVMLTAPTLDNVLDRVAELKAQGLVQHRDFDFAYFPPVIDNYTYTTIKDRHAIFTFHTELGKKHASLFALRWT
jgi:hypothetical protein